MKRKFTPFFSFSLITFFSVLGLTMTEGFLSLNTSEEVKKVEKAKLALLSPPVPTAIAFDLVNGTDQNLNSFSVSTSGGADPETWSPGDWFGVGAYGSWPQGTGVPFALADDSVNNISGGGVFGSDTQGIIDGTTPSDEPFFGAVDMVNGNNAGGSATATWEFDISNATNLSLSIDMAAMGDFETSDSYVWSYSIDGVYNKLHKIVTLA